MKKHLALLLSLIVSTMVSCGGGGGGGGSSPSGVTPPPVSGTTPLAGKVVDGYVQGATVCLVKVGTLTCAGAQYLAGAPTDAEGRFTFSNVPDIVKNDPTYYIISTGGTDSATQQGIPATTVYKAPANAEVVTPLTTLVVETALAGSGSLTASAVSQAVSNIAAVAGIDAAAASEAILGSDYLEDSAKDMNARQALALSIIITQLNDQKVVDGGGNFSSTISMLAHQLRSSSALPVSTAELAVNAASAAHAGSPDAKAKAQALVSAVGQALTTVVNALSGTADPQGLFSSVEARLATTLTAMIPQVDSSNVDAMAGSMANAASHAVISSSASGKTADLANLDDAAVRQYLLAKASEAGIADLLGVNVSAITSLAVTKQAPGIAGKAAMLPGSGTSCSGRGNATVAVSCSEIFGASVCSDATGAFSATLTCTGENPGDFTITMNGFNMPALGITMSGTLDMDKNTMTFTNLTSGTTTLNGSVKYSIDPVTFDFLFSVKGFLSVASPQWKSLLLDGFTSGKIIVGATNSSTSKMTLYLSGKGTLADNTAVSLALAYVRVQDAAIGDDLVDVAITTLDGSIQEGPDLIQYNGFKVTNVRHFNAVTDEHYAYKDSSVDGRSKIVTSKYGYAYLKGTNIRFTYDAVTRQDKYTSGTLTLSKSAQ